MWQFMIGVYIGTIYDCQPVVLHVSKMIFTQIPPEVIPKKR